MSKKTDLNDEEKALFRDAMMGVKPLSHTKITPESKKLPAKLRDKKKDEPLDIQYFIFSDFEKLEPVNSNSILNFARSGLQHKILRNLRTGQYNIEATLDLHGMTAEEAKQSLQLFLVNCLQHRLRHVLIIHGKGRSNTKPILKNKLNHWLREIEDVLAFYSAIAKDGSTGALYVLLRRK